MERGAAAVRSRRCASPAVVRGAGGWFFYGDDKAIDDYANAEPLTPEAIANWRAAVRAAARWLDARGIAYVFTIAPDKHVIYGEEMPPTIARINEVSRARVPRRGEKTVTARAGAVGRLVSATRAC